MPSSVIRRFVYDEARRCLTITFTSGQVYAYDAVPPEMVEALATAASKGRFFGSEVRGRYAYRRLGNARTA